MANHSLQSSTFGNTSFFKQDLATPHGYLPTPGRLDAAQTAVLLGCQEHDIPILVNRGLLEPLGNPIQNARKYFAAVHVLALAQDPVWLNKATKILYQHWAGKNAERRKGESETALIAA